METKRSPFFRPGEMAFTVVVIAGYVVMFSTMEIPLYTQTSLLMIVLGAFYLGAGLYGSRLIDEYEKQKPYYIWIFLVVELVLGSVIVSIGQNGPWLILLPLVGTAVQHLSRRSAILVVVAILAIQIYSIYPLAGLAQALAWGMSFLAADVFVGAFSLVALNERLAREALAEANQKLRQYAAQVEELAVAQERNRLAREIHDGLGHYLTSINIQLKAAQAIAANDPAQAGEAIANAQTLTQEALADVRRSISALRADPATSRPLPETIGRLLSENTAAGLKGEFVVAGPPRPLSPQVEYTLYRVAQEGLTNVRKHAHATRADLRLAYAEHSVRLTLNDDGVGSDDNAASGGFGLVGLRERIELVGGTLKVSTAPNQGFSIEVEIPG